MSNRQKDRLNEAPGVKRCDRIPWPARLIDTAIAIVLSTLSGYHFTQPNQAWRSGIIELSAASLLLVAAHRVDHQKAMIINLVVAVEIFTLGIRHLIHGGGWGSGTTELFFALILVITARGIHKTKEHDEQKN
jgi:hypothetical protein